MPKTYEKKISSKQSRFDITYCTDVVDWCLYKASGGYSIIYLVLNEIALLQFRLDCAKHFVIW